MSRLAWIVPLFFVAASAGAEVFSGVASTVVIEVPVEVTVDGEPLRGLTASDFEVLDGGKRQEVTGFEVIDLKTVETGPGRPAAFQLPIVARRHFLLLFDLSFSTPVGIERARQAALELVREELHPADLVAVGRYARARGAELILGFTTDREQVALALEGLEIAHLLERRTDPLKLSFGADLNVGTNAGKGLAAKHYADLSEKARQALYEQGRGDVGALSGSLKELALLMRKIEGRKHVVYLSEGFDDTLLHGATDEARRRELNQAAGTGEYWKVTSDELFGDGGVAGGIEEAVREFRRADCTVHSVDVGGLRAESAQHGHGAGRGGLFTLAAGTGGELYENTNDLGQAMHTLLEKTSVTYLLAFQPQRLKLDGGYHQLKVKLKNPPKGARITHRPGYFAPDPKATPSPLERQLTVAQQLLEGQEGGVIDGAVWVLPRRAGVESGGLADVLVEVDGASLLEGVKGSSLRLEVYVYAMDAAGGMSDVSSQTLTLDLDRAGDTLSRTGLKYSVPLLLPPGEHRVRVLVNDPQTGRTGLRIAGVTMPAEGAAATLPSSPISPEPSEGWLLVRGSRPDLEIEPSDDPFFSGLQALAATPSSSPEVPQLEDGEPENPSEQGFEIAYRRLLRGLSEGERTVLTAEVAELIIATYGERPERLGRLGRSEHEAAQELARRDPEALVPLLLLHHDLVLEYRRRSQPHLVLHGIERVRQLTDGYAQSAGSAGARVLASDVLASLGGHLQESGRSASLELFEHALRLEPSHTAALLGLAAYYEKRGGPYETAVGHLERLVAAHPEHREGCLRLGINLLRLDRDPEGVARLESLLESSENDWVTSLAAQELARHHAREERIPAAIDLLRAALERLPGDQKLHLQLAWLLDRSSEPAAVRRLIEKVARLEPASQPARGRYNQWPRQDLEENRAELRRWCENRLKLVAGVFDDEPAEARP